jgi:hypothetical protein
MQIMDYTDLPEAILPNHPSRQEKKAKLKVNVLKKFQTLSFPLIV